MEVAVNNIAINVPAVSLLLCSIFSNSFINCQNQNQNQNQQNQCDVIQPTGWESRLDSSGVRASTELGPVARGTNVTWSCPASKMSSGDGKSSWVGACLENPQTPGFSVFVYSWPGQSWPECQCPSTATCKMDGANASATVTTRYVSGPGSGYLPGAELKIPLPMSDSVLGWSVKITWDIPTVQNNIQLTSKTQGVRMEKLDFPGSQYDFRPIDMAFSFDGLVNLDLGFNFLDKNIRENNKKWHYPCVAKLECQAQVEESTNYLALAMVLGSSVGLVFLIGCCCASCVWCLKHDSAYGSSRLVSAYSIRTLKKVRPYSAYSEDSS